MHEFACRRLERLCGGPEIGLWRAVEATVGAPQWCRDVGVGFLIQPIGYLADPIFGRYNQGLRPSQLRAF